MARKLIITIDGGGIRGVMPLVHLREIQLMLKKNLDEYDVEWWGTSTGAIISAALASQKDALFIHRIQATLDIYEFRSETASNPFGTANPARAFNKLIEYNFEDVDFKDHPELHIVSCRMDTAEPAVFRSDSKCKLVEAIKASCAVPGIFPPVTIRGVDFVDGFVVAKNPVMLALKERELNDNVVVLSLGCGKLRKTDAIEEQVEEAHQAAKKLAELTGFHYFRFDPPLNFAHDHMQNANPTNIFNLKKDAMAAIFHEHHLLRSFVQLMDEE